jgi:small GTP-binding protein
MIQKKICLVGVFGAGKTSLVKQFVHAKFSEKYHSTIGVKIDRKTVDLRGTEVNLLLWDLAGKDAAEDIRPSYLKGSAGIFFVLDGTRRETYDELAALRAVVNETLGEVPFVVALNKNDLMDEWALTDADEAALSEAGCHVVSTSAKSGDGVDEAFRWLATKTISA